MLPNLCLFFINEYRAYTIQNNCAWVLVWRLLGNTNNTRTGEATQLELRDFLGVSLFTTFTLLAFAYHFQTKVLK